MPRAAFASILGWDRLFHLVEPGVECDVGHGSGHTHSDLEDIPTTNGARWPSSREALALNRALTRWPGSPAPQRVRSCRKAPAGRKTWLSTIDVAPVAEARELNLGPVYFEKAAVAAHSHRERAASALESPNVAARPRTIRVVCKHFKQVEKPFSNMAGQPLHLAPCARVQKHGVDWHVYRSPSASRTSFQSWPLKVFIRLLCRRSSFAETFSRGR